MPRPNSPASTGTRRRDSSVATTPNAGMNPSRQHAVKIALRWRSSVVGCVALTVCVLLGIVLFVANRTPEATGVAGKMIPGLILGELRSPDADPIETRKESVFEQKVRFVSGKHHHVVFEVPGDKEFVLKRYLFVGSLEGEILAEREGKYSSIETFTRSVGASFSAGKGSIFPPGTRIVLHTLTGNGTLNYTISGYVRPLSGTVSSKLPVTVNSSIGMTLQLIPAGDFQMGSPDMGSPDSEEERGENIADERPRHHVRITKPFYLGTFEVTQWEWEVVTGSNPSYFSKTGGGAKELAGLNTSYLSVESISWYETIEFCNKLSERDGFPAFYTLSSAERADGTVMFATVSPAAGGAKGYRLPSEAEWEYACRAETVTPFHFGKENNGTQSNVNGDFPYGTITKGWFLNQTRKGGEYPANDFKLYDMHGNVSEWCFDTYDEKTYEMGITVDPCVTRPGDKRVTRGGSWYHDARRSRSAARGCMEPSNRYNWIGFRIARTP